MSTNTFKRQPVRNEEEQEEQNRYSLVVRFGKDMLSDGFTAMPNLLLDLYAELGITHCELVFLMHLMQHKWSRAEPYPSLGTIATKMGLSLRAVQNHVQSLRHKAFRCPHAHQNAEEGGENASGCSCPKYLVVTHRYRAGIGQTSSSYNLSGLFAAIITLAREKGLLKGTAHAKNYTPPHEESCTGGMQVPAYESNESKNTQSEPDESFSNALGGKDEVPVSCSHEAMATRNPEGQPRGVTEKAPTQTVSNKPPNMHHHTHPSRPNHDGASNRETSRSQEAGRPRQSFFRNDEVKREAREQPRMTAPPLTQEEMNQRIRERLAREQARIQMHNPLPGIIPDSDWNKLEQDHPTSQLPLRCKPMPVYPRLQAAIEEISEKLGDFHHAKSNITHADNIRRQANVSLEQFLQALEEARYATHTASQKGLITKRDEAGRLVKMSYFFAVVRQKLGLPPKGGQAGAPANSYGVAQ